MEVNVLLHASDLFTSMDMILDRIDKEVGPIDGLDALEEGIASCHCW
jgi:hypothetical protein